jgi:hypothetical protein
MDGKTRRLSRRSTRDAGSPRDLPAGVATLPAGVATLPPAARRSIGLALGLTVLLVAGLLVAEVRRDPGTPANASGGPGYDWASPVAHRPNASGFSVGVTHGQYSIDDWGDDESARLSARSVLTAVSTYQNQHLFGWGTLNPEPSPGVFDWSSLDRRMRLIRATGGTPVLTLCCAPDWMKGGRPGQTDWDRLTAAPDREHYDDFAALAVAAARRYRDVRHFLVWNEMKGFWDDTANRWDYQSYTALYNTVYDALKAAVPGVLVGGPYVVVDVWADALAGGRPAPLSGECGTVDQRSLDVLEYWLKNKHGADFVALDGGTVPRDAGSMASVTAASAVFGAITRWLRKRTSLPVWWSELHVGKEDLSRQPQLVATTVAALLHLADQHAAVALLWQPQDVAAAGDPRAPALWSSTLATGGGQPLPLAEPVARMQELLADPADGDPVTWAATDVGVLRGRTALLLVNTAARGVAVRVQGLGLRLRPYEVRYAPLPPGAAPAPPQWWTPAIDRCLRELPQPSS